MAPGPGLPLLLASSPRPAAAARGTLSEGPGHGRVQQAHLTESDRACSKRHASERAVTPSRPGPGTLPLTAAATRGSLGEIMMTSRACTNHANSAAQLDVMRIRRFRVAGPDSSGIKPISPKLILPFGATQSDVHCTA